MAVAAPVAAPVDEGYTVDKDTIKDILENEDRLNTEVDTFFVNFDADESGKLDADEFRQLVFGICGFIGLPNPPKDVYMDMFKDTDQDGDEQIDKAELAKFMKKLLELVMKSSDEDIKKMHEEAKKFEEEELKKAEAPPAEPEAKADADEEADEGEGGEGDSEEKDDDDDADEDEDEAEEDDEDDEEDE